MGPISTSFDSYSGQRDGVSVKNTDFDSENDSPDSIQNQIVNETDPILRSLKQVLRIAASKSQKALTSIVQTAAPAVLPLAQAAVSAAPTLQQQQQVQTATQSSQTANSIPATVQNLGQGGSQIQQQVQNGPLPTQQQTQQLLYPQGQQYGSTGSVPAQTGTYQTNVQQFSQNNQQLQGNPISIQQSYQGEDFLDSLFWTGFVLFVAMSTTMFVKWAYQDGVLRYHQRMLELSDELVLQFGETQIQQWQESQNLQQSNSFGRQNHSQGNPNLRTTTNYSGSSTTSGRNQQGNYHSDISNLPNDLKQHVMRNANVNYIGQQTNNQNSDQVQQLQLHSVFDGVTQTDHGDVNLNSKISTITAKGQGVKIFSPGRFSESSHSRSVAQDQSQSQNDNQIQNNSDNHSESQQSLSLSQQESTPEIDINQQQQDQVKLDTGGTNTTGSSTKRILYVYEGTIQDPVRRIHHNKFDDNQDHDDLDNVTGVNNNVQDIDLKSKSEDETLTVTSESPGQKQKNNTNDIQLRARFDVI